MNRIPGVSKTQLESTCAASGGSFTVEDWGGYSCALNDGYAVDCFNPKACFAMCLSPLKCGATTTNRPFAHQNLFYGGSIAGPQSGAMPKAGVGAATTSTGMGFVAPNAATGSGAATTNAAVQAATAQALKMSTTHSGMGLGTIRAK
jgi:hypothetical protein